MSDLSNLKVINIEVSPAEFAAIQALIAADPVFADENANVTFKPVEGGE